MRTPKRKAVRCANTLTAIKETNIQANMNATDFIATCARQASAGAAFHAKPYVGIDRRQYRAVSRRDTIHSGASHTTKQAGNLPDSEVFSRSEFEAVLTFQGSDGYGAGSAYPQGRQHNLFCVTKPSSTRRPSQADGGLSVQQGTKTMTTPTPKAASLGITPATFPGSVQRQIAIETALADALYYIRMPYSAKTLNATTARTRRAASMLKQACTEAKIGGAV